MFQGSAGTGKIVINYIFNLPEYRDWKICLAATTNKAVAVMQQMGKISADKEENLDYLTLHKLKTKRVIDVNGEPQFVINQSAIF